MCGECGGYWVGQVALKAIANRREMRFADAVKERFLQVALENDSTEPLLCMGCGKYMKKERFKDWDDILIDVCPSCEGIWLDAGEIEKIQIYWEYFQDHPEQSNMELIERRALLEAELAQRRRDFERACEDMRESARHRGLVDGNALASSLRAMLFPTR